MLFVFSDLESLFKTRDEQKQQPTTTPSKPIKSTNTNTIDKITDISSSSSTSTSHPDIISTYNPSLPSFRPFYLIWDNTPTIIQDDYTYENNLLKQYETNRVNKNTTVTSNEKSDDEEGGNVSCCFLFACYLFAQVLLYNVACST